MHIPKQDRYGPVILSEAKALTRHTEILSEAKDDSASCGRKNSLGYVGRYPHINPASAGTATSSVFLAACPPLSTSFTLVGSAILLILFNTSPSTMITSASLPS